MKKFLFQELLLVSHKEKRAKKVQFHPLATVLKGRNDTGKSSIAKSIYQTLGAEPAMEHPRWRAAGVTSLLRFTLDGVNYSAFRSGKQYGLFENENLLGKYNSVTNEYGPELARILDFKMTLKSRQGIDVIPPPAYQFLPYYIDQDRGWSQNWASFSRLAQFSSWRGDLANYHTGMRSSEWYEARAIIARALLEMKHPMEEREVLNRLLAKVKIDLAKIPVEIDLGSYRKEIALLLEVSSAISKQQQKYRQKVVELNSQKLQLAAQRDILLRVRKELNADYTYAVDVIDDDELPCPTCGQMYENTFAERFSLAQDEARASDLLAEVTVNLGVVGKRLHDHQADLKEMEKRSERAKEVLAKKKGEMTLQDIIDTQGTKQLHQRLSAKIEDLENGIGRLAAIKADADKKLKEAGSKETRKKISGEYLSHMASNLRKLEVRNLSEDDYKRIDCTIKETGSDLPRAILAYTFSILRLAREYGTATFCPIIIDSPRQQDQDEENHIRMLNFVKYERPEGSQLVLCLVDDGDVDFGGDVIELDEEDYVLSEASYGDVSGEISSAESKIYK